jgi:hypothetical protein
MKIPFQFGYEGGFRFGYLLGCVFDCRLVLFYLGYWLRVLRFVIGCLLGGGVPRNFLGAGRSTADVLRII